MQISNPMSLANLLNSEPPHSELSHLKVETTPSPRANTFTCVNFSPLKSDPTDIKLQISYSIPSPPESIYSPTQSHRSYDSPLPSPQQQFYTPPIEHCQLAFRPRANSDYQLPTDNQQKITLPSINVLGIQGEFGPTHPLQNRRSSYEQYPQTVLSQRELKARNRSLPSHHLEEYQQQLMGREKSDKHRLAGGAIKKPNSRRLPRKKDRNHSNSKYTIQQVHYIRYNKNDLDRSFAGIGQAFERQFPESEKRETDQCFSSRFYRDHVVPVVTENWKLTYDKSQKIVMKQASIRKNDLPEFKNVPVDLVSRLPHIALTYSWVTPQHKERARAIIAQDERELAMGWDFLTEAGKWRHVIALSEGRPQYAPKQT